MTNPGEGPHKRIHRPAAAPRRRRKTSPPPGTATSRGRRNRSRRPRSGLPEPSFFASGRESPRGENGCRRRGTGAPPSEGGRESLGRPDVTGAGRGGQDHHGSPSLRHGVPPPLSPSSRPVPVPFPDRYRCTKFFIRNQTSWKPHAFISSSPHSGVHPSTL